MEAQFKNVNVLIGKSTPIPAHGLYSSPSLKLKLYFNHYETPCTKLILPNQTYKTQPNQTKISKGTKAKRQNKIHEPNWQIQTLIKAKQVWACPSLISGRELFAEFGT